MQPDSHSEYCAEQVRLHDYDRYFAAIPAAPDVRRGLMALYAFNLEVASTAERVSEPLIGEMRLQWWRDTLEGIYGGNVRDHAVARELADAIRRHDLPRSALERIVDARAFDLGDEAPEDRAALATYAEATGGVLSALAGTICGVPNHDAALSTAGRAWAYAGLLRAIPFHAARGVCFVPKDALRAHGAPSRPFQEGAGRPDLSGPVSMMAEEAATLLTEARSAVSALPKDARPAVAHLAIVPAYLARLRKRGHDPFASGLEPGRLSRQARMLRANMTGKI